MWYILKRSQFLSIKYVQESLGREMRDSNSHSGCQYSSIILWLMAAPFLCKRNPKYSLAFTIFGPNSRVCWRTRPTDRISIYNNLLEYWMLITEWLMIRKYIKYTTVVHNVTHISAVFLCRPLRGRPCWHRPEPPPVNYITCHGILAAFWFMGVKLFKEISVGVSSRNSSLLRAG